jgi:glycine betaine/proline transport system substrate-binding protein
VFIFLRQLLRVLRRCLPRGRAPRLDGARRWLDKHIEECDFKIAVSRFAAARRDRPRWRRKFALWWRRHLSIFKRRRRRDGQSKLLVVGLAAAILPVVVAIHFGREVKEKKDEPAFEEIYRSQNGAPLVRIVYISDWDSSVATAYLNAQILRTRLAAEVLLKPLPLTRLAEAWAQLATNRADVFFSGWMPTQAEFARQAGERVARLGTLATDARLGLAVPQWMDVETLADLAAGGGVIYAIDPDSKLSHLTRRAIEDYGLTRWRLDERNEPYLWDKLREAEREHQPVVVTAWTPHALFAEFPLKFLADPRGIYGDSDTINIYAATPFIGMFEELSGFFRREKLTMTEYAELLRAIQGDGDIVTQIKIWLDDHQPLIDEWLRKK